jgi:drug/metabolite transporter (DMT)-like permease
MPMPVRQFSGLIAGFAITLTWSSWIMATRLGLKTDIGVYDLLALRFIVACLVLTPVLWFLGTWKGLSARRYLILAVLGGLPQNILTYEAVERSPVALVSVFMYGTTPIVTAFISYLFLRKKITIEQAFGSVVIFGGIFLMTGVNTGVNFGPRVWSGNIMAVLAIASFASFIIYAERWQVSVAQSLTACTVLNGLFFLPLWFVFADGALLGNHSLGDLMFQGALQGLVPGVFAMFVTTYAARTIGAGAVSLFYAMIPVCAGSLAVLLLDEGLTLMQASGIGVATIGIVMASTNRKTWMKRNWSNA